MAETSKKRGGKAATGVALGKKTGGRPCKYSPEIAREICNRLADGEPLRQICRDKHMPAWRTVYDWMYQDDTAGEESVGLSASIAKARELGQDAIAEEIYNFVSEKPEYMMTEAGPKVDSGYVQWMRVQADIKLKLLAKWNPRRFGDKVSVAGDAENPVQVSHVHEVKTMFDSILQNMELKRQEEAAKARGEE